mmetsp:Transcript_20841/g.59768  ORF Transcript_20841/g.59768 Transcript_20841/m.59768 type:complete len:327 (-) Transcript_20841:2602-3582(-)
MLRLTSKLLRQGFPASRRGTLSSVESSALDWNAGQFQRTFSRGLDSKEYISQHAKRLDEEIAIEKEGQYRYLKMNESKWQDMKKVEKKIHERVNWSDDAKFTRDELDMIESVLGYAAVQDVASKWARKWNLDKDDVLKIKFHLLDVCESLSKYVDTRDDTRKKFLHRALLCRIDSLPSVDPELDFPNKGEVMIRYANQKAEDSKLAGQNIFPFKMKNTIESPVGPVSSSASYEELSQLETIHLQELHRQGVGAGACISRTKLYVNNYLRSVCVVEQDPHNSCTGWWRPGGTDASVQYWARSRNIRRYRLSHRCQILPQESIPQNWQ